jgi:N-acetyl-gamma-glutamyl-phosphate reductase
MAKVFIDGSAGTTGLRIYDRLSARDDIELVTLPDELRKDLSARREALNNCDAAFLCLPDAAATEAAGLIENPDVTVLDTSTAHRTAPGWAYGFPELGTEFLDNIVTGRRIAVPGCHASGFVALVHPLVKNGILPADALLTCHSVTGYSGGGKKMIAQYEEENRDIALSSPRQYALTQNHKHLKEMQAVCALQNAPVFCPIVADYYSGMCVTVPVFASQLCEGKTADDIKALYSQIYRGTLVRYTENAGEDGFMSANALSYKDYMQVTVEGNDERILLIARFDNLGKGASGAAVECLNIKIGAPREKGLDL